MVISSLLSLPPCRVPLCFSPPRALFPAYDYKKETGREKKIREEEVKKKKKSDRRTREEEEKNFEPSPLPPPPLSIIQTSSPDLRFAHRHLRWKASTTTYVTDGATRRETQARRRTAARKAADREFFTKRFV